MRKPPELTAAANFCNDRVYVIPLNPGEGSTTYLADADAIVVDPGEVTSRGLSPAPSVEDEDGGAFKIGISVVEIEDSGPLNVGLKRSAGYAASWLTGRAGFLDADAAQREGWVIPQDRKVAEKMKQELKKRMEEKKRKEAAEKVKKQQQSNANPFES